MKKIDISQVVAVLVLLVSLVGLLYIGRATNTPDIQIGGEIISGKGDEPKPEFVNYPTDSKISEYIKEPEIVTGAPIDFGPYYSDVVKDTGVVWLPDHPKAPESINERLKAAGFQLYTPTIIVGKQGEQNIYFARYACQDLCFGSLRALFLEDGRNLKLIANHSSGLPPDDPNDSYYEINLPSDITVDKTTTFPSLLLDKQFSYKGEKLILNENIPGLLSVTGAVISTPRSQGLIFLQQTKFGPLFRVLTESKGYYLERFMLRHESGLAQEYRYKLSFMGDDGIPAITWNDGTKNKDPYRIDGTGGCGGGGAVSVAGPGVIIDSDLVKLGMTSTGEEIFGFKSPNHPIIKTFYDSFGGKYYSYGPKASTGKEDVISKEQYHKLNGLLVYKGSLGRYLIMSSRVYGPMAECAKPVIYLYPKEKTKVSVGVGANITQSEPLYEGGWSVTAFPDGKLINRDGKKYNSLFWDGFGYGYYPEVKNRGLVVSRDVVSVTLSNQLKQLGLNETESNDFLEYWLPLMPQAPFVRLTWLGTKEMDELAPLSVTPAPDTNIRIFLDFEGLQQYQKLEPQTLSSKKRTGFTLVEWGGLRR